MCCFKVIVKIGVCLTIMKWDSMEYYLNKFFSCSFLGRELGLFIVNASERQHPICTVLFGQMCGKPISQI